MNTYWMNIIKSIIHISGRMKNFTINKFTMESTNWHVNTGHVRHITHTHVYHTLWEEHAFPYTKHYIFIYFTHYSEY